MAFELVSPELYDSTEIELTNDFMRLDECIHVSFEAVFGVDTLLVELYLYETVRICSDDKVYFSPIDHDDFLNIVHNIW